MVTHGAKSRATARRLELTRATNNSLARAQICFVTVPDGNVAAVAETIAMKLGARTAVVHCAGALGLDGLGSEAALGGRARGSFHPLCALSAPTDSVAGYSVAISSNSAGVVRVLRQTARALELTPITAPDSARAAYHAGAVMSAGGLVCLLSAAVRVWSEAGIAEADALEALLPLMRSALQNVSERGLERGLTGPFVRGDAEAVKRHIRSLPADLRPLYRSLGTEALRLAGPTLTDAQRRALGLSLRTGP